MKSISEKSPMGKLMRNFCPRENAVILKGICQSRKGPAPESLQALRTGRVAALKADFECGIFPRTRVEPWSLWSFAPYWGEALFVLSEVLKWRSLKVYLSKSIAARQFIQNLPALAAQNSGLRCEIIKGLAARIFPDIRTARPLMKKGRETDLEKI